MINSNNDHFRQYLYKNYIEEKDLKITLSKIDEAKCEKLGEFRRKKYSFVARHSRHVTSSESTKDINRQNGQIDSKEVYEKPKISQKMDLKCNMKGISFRRERTSSLHLRRPFQMETDRQISNDCLKLPPLTDRKSKTNTESENLVPDNVVKLDDTSCEKDEKEVKKNSLDTNISKIRRCNTERNLKNVAVPISKIHLFRQLSHRVSRMSTWYYLLRDVFERLSNNEELGQNSESQGKSTKEHFEELKACRYLRMPPLHRITPTYASSEFTE